MLLALIIAATAVAQTNLPTQLRGVGIDQKLDAQIPLDLVFQDESGTPKRLGDYFGAKPVIVSLVYHECPMLCNLVLNGLVRAMRALSFDAGKEFEVITLSINPRETPAQAAEKKLVYLGRYGRPAAASGWHFLTGQEPAIRQLAAAVGFRYSYDPITKTYAHASGIMVLTPRGRVARYFYGLEYSARDLRWGLVEASANRIGSPVDQVLLFCFHYDPATGRYGPVVLRTVRMAGIATVLALSTFLVTMLRRERRERR